MELLGRYPETSPRSAGAGASCPPQFQGTAGERRLDRPETGTAAVGVRVVGDPEAVGGGGDVAGGGGEVVAGAVGGRQYHRSGGRV